MCLSVRWALDVIPIEREGAVFVIEETWVFRLMVIIVFVFNTI